MPTRVNEMADDLQCWLKASPVASAPGVLLQSPGADATGLADGQDLSSGVAFVVAPQADTPSLESGHIEITRALHLLVVQEGANSG